MQTVWLIFTIEKPVTSAWNAINDVRTWAPSNDEFGPSTRIKNMIVADRSGKVVDVQSLVSS